MLTLLIILSILVSFGIIRKQRVIREQKRFERSCKRIKKLIVAHSHTIEKFVDSQNRKIKKLENKLKKRVRRSGR
jgi:regulatory protein YycH of two-component signal transduction system YycFG